ncbi:MAG TPA: glycerate kinase [Nitrospirae bacterium]|nr:glycerate kinase [Nitrospirota bacterium]
MNQKKIVHDIFLASLKAVDPYRAVSGAIAIIRNAIATEKINRIVVVGAGKASSQMASAIEHSIGSDSVIEGIVITKYGHAVRTEVEKIRSSEDIIITSVEDEKIGGSEVKNLSASQPLSLSTSQSHESPISVYEAGHPIPDENGLKATQEVINLLKSTDSSTLVLMLISGGGSALLVSPQDGISLSEKQKITDLLLKAGADITELNTVRKHLSKVKGGRLAEIAHPAKVVTFILSDVIGDKLDVIASGPTVPDTSTYADAMAVIKKFKLIEIAPKSILDLINDGIQGRASETPKEDSPVFKNIDNVIIGSNIIALDAAKKEAEELGFNAEIICSDLSGEAVDAGNWLAEKAKERHSSSRSFGTSCLISGGETTVKVKGSGKGGRNMELALSFAKEIEGIEGITLLSAGTDGNDGPTDAAGAIVDGGTISKAKTLGLDANEYLNNNDSYNIFKQIDSLLITGPTGTNVMDVQIVLIQ